MEEFLWGTVFGMVWITVKNILYTVHSPYIHTCKYIANKLKVLVNNFHPYYLQYYYRPGPSKLILWAPSGSCPALWFHALIAVVKSDQFSELSPAFKKLSRIYFVVLLCPEAHYIKTFFSHMYITVHDIVVIYYYEMDSTKFEKHF